MLFTSMKRIPFLFILLWVFLYLGQDISISGIVLAISLLLHNMHFMLKSIKNNNKVLFLMYLLMITYSLPLLYYYIFDTPISRYYFDAASTEYVYKVGMQLFLFHIILASSLDFDNKQKNISFRNVYIYIICVIISIGCIIISRGGNVFADGGYRNSLDVGGRDSILGYGVVFISLSLLYANSKFRLYIVYCIAFLFVLKNLLSGGRIETMSLCLAFYCIRFQYKFSIKITFILLSVAFVLMTLWGIVRAEGNMDVVLTANNLTENGNAMDVFYSSMRINYLIDRGILGFEERIYSGLLFIISIVMPYSSLPALANLSSYMQLDYRCGGGGLIPTFFYTWGGYFGIVLIALFISTCLNRSNRANFSPYWRFYSILLVAMIPRWFAYYPIHLFKYCLYGTIIFIAFNIIFKKYSLRLIECK